MLINEMRVRLHCSMYFYNVNTSNDSSFLLFPLVCTGAFLVAFFCRGGPRLPFLLHRHPFMSLQQLGPRPSGAEEIIRLHLQETSHSQVGIHVFSSETG